MKRHVLPASLLCLAIAGCASHDLPRVDPDVPASAPLAGQWTPVSAELGGKDFPVSNFAGASLQLTEHTYAFAGDRGTCSVLSVTPPARMDIQGVEGPNAGHLIPAVYELHGDQLTISYQLGPGVRPKDFSSPAGSQILVVHYQMKH